MKTTIAIFLLIGLFLFTGIGSHVDISANKKRIDMLERKVVVFDSLYAEGLRVQYRIDSLAVEVEKIQKRFE